MTHIIDLITVSEIKFIKRDTFRKKRIRNDKYSRAIYLDSYMMYAVRCTLYAVRGTHIYEYTDDHSILRYYEYEYCHLLH